MSFLELPRDVQLYILGRVVWDYYTKWYSGERDIHWGLCVMRFHKQKAGSFMTQFLIQLSAVHPKIRKRLKEVTVWMDVDTYVFDPKLIVTRNLWR